MKKTYHLTEHGKRELEEELATLKSSRTDIAEKIADARAYGDLSENAEYSAAREEQGRVETRIAEIEEILLNTDIIADAPDGIVGLGSVVTLQNGKKSIYTIVGPVEADPLEGKISNESPLGQALMDKKVSDQVKIETPKGTVDYKILEIA